MKPNVILIVCCSLRKDFLGAKTPNLDKLAADGMSYDSCISPGTWTFPSHVSLFTGMYPHEHGVHEMTKGEKLQQVAVCRRNNMALSAPRISEELEAKGYNTICISNNFMLSAKESGFHYGFGTFLSYNASPWFHSDLAIKAQELGASPMQVLVKLIGKGKISEIPKYARELSKIKRIARETNYPRDKGITETVRKLEKIPLPQSFFLMLGLFDMHEPYPSFSGKDNVDSFTGIREIPNETLKKLEEEYRESVEILDSGLGKIFSTLKKRGLYDNSLIIVTADHGQAFREHGFMYHGIYLYDEIVRVPLIIKYPRGRKFKKREGYQSLTNIPSLILNIIKGKDDSVLTTRKAFAESYGNIDYIPESYRSRQAYIDEKYEKARAAIYMEGYKLNVNGGDGIVEEFMEGSKNVGIEKHKKAFKKLAGELARFKKKEKFIIPD